MALIKCEECGHDVSDKAVSCPNCGYVINGEKPIKNDLVKSKIYKEKPNVLLSIIMFFISFVILIIMLLETTYAKNYSYNFSFLELLSGKFINYRILILVFGFLIFIGYILKITSKRNCQKSNIVYYLSLVLFIFYNFVVHQENYQIKISYSLIYICILILLFIKNKFSLVENNIEVSTDEISSLEEKNKKTKDSFEHKYNNKIFLIINILFTIIGIGSSIFFMNSNVLKNKPLTSIESISELKNEKLYAIIKNDYINVRSENNVNSKKIGEVKKDEIYEVVEIKTNNGDKWYKVIDKEGYSGYIANIDNEYLTLSKEIDSTTISSIHDKVVEKQENKVVEKEETKEKYEETKKESETTSTKKETTKSTTKKGATKSTTVKTEETQKEIKEEQPIVEKEEVKEEQPVEKKDCSNEINERTKKYNDDKNRIESSYEERIQKNSNDLHTASLNLSYAGGYISESSFNSRMNTLNREYSTAMTNYQRAAMDSSGSSASRVRTYQNQLRDILQEQAELKARYNASSEYDSYQEMNNYLLKCEKNDLQALYDEFSKDLDNINNNCK